MKKIFDAAMKRTRRFLPVAGLAFLFLSFHGCSQENPAQPQSELQISGDYTPFSVAPDFCPNLPTHEVVPIHTQPGATSLFDIWFWGIGPGYDISDGTNTGGWCLEDIPVPNVRDPGKVTLWCSYDDALPGNLGDLPLNELNYLLNHRWGDWKEIQAAIWLLTWGEPTTFPATANSYAMAAEALANGKDFIPGPGELIAIILYTGDGGIHKDPVGFQDTFLEIRLPGTPPPPPSGDGACTPGYWKTHYDRWPAPYSFTDDFDTIFGTDYFSPDITLGQAAWLGGGGVNKLARHGTAALLNAAHGDVNYPYTVAEVIAMVQAGDADTLANVNDELECVLEGTSADPHFTTGD